MLRRISIAVLAALISLASLSAPAQAKGEKWTLLVSSIGGLYRTTVEDGRVAKNKKLLESGGLISASSKILVTPYVDNSVYVMSYPKLRELAIFDKYPRQRTVVGASRNSVVALQTNPNGENADVIRKDLKWGDETILGSIDLKDELAETSNWIENDVSTPLGEGMVYFGARTSREFWGPNKYLGYMIYAVPPGGAPTPFYYIDGQPYGGFISDFCVSPSGKRVAFTNPFPGGSRYQEQIHVRDVETGQTWTTQGDNSLGSSCFVDDDTLILSGGAPVLVEVKGERLKRSRIKGFPSEFFGTYEVLRVRQK